MTAQRDPDQLIHAFLEEGQSVLPDRVYDAVRDRIEQTRQRVFIGPRRTTPMAKFIAYGLATAAVAVVAVFIGFNVLGGSNIGAPTPTSTPTPTATPSPIPTVAATPVRLPTNGVIAPGRYHLNRDSVHYSYAISSELWQTSQPGYDGFIETRAAFPGPGFAWITPLIRLDVVAVDPCAGTETPVTSMDDAATALTQIAGTKAAAPTDLTVNGVPGKLVVLTIDGDFACDETSFWLYGDVSFYPSDKASVIRDWVFDLDGQTYLFHTDQIGSDAVLSDDIQQIIGSIQFD